MGRGVCVIDYEHWFGYDCSLCWDIHCHRHPLYVAETSKKEQQLRYRDLRIDLF